MLAASKNPQRIAVVVPCYRVKEQVQAVLDAMPEFVERIYCVDDCCPDGSGDHITQCCHDPRVRLLRHDRNEGVGGAMVTGYRAALADDMEIVVKIDGDGQMDPALLPAFVRLIESGEVDYCKGNRFYRAATLAGMPWPRLVGNAFLSFLTKLSSGYWGIFDPNNGYTAIHASALKLLPLEAIDKGYFFEADILCRLNIVRAVVRDIPMTAVYRDELSSLKIRKVLWTFLRRHGVNFCKRIAYNYYVRDFNIASIEAPIGLVALIFGVTFGSIHWVGSYVGEEYASAGTVMLAALPVIVGMQLLLSAFNYDIQNVPRTPLQTLFREENSGASSPARDAVTGDSEMGDAQRADNPEPQRDVN